MSKDNSIKIGNILVLIIAISILGIAIYTATQDGTYINDAIKKAKNWQFIFSVISLILFISLTVKFAKDSKDGSGMTLLKIILWLIPLILSIAIFYI